MKRILIVDDNALNRALVSTYLKREGYRVSLADGGEKAVELALSDAPDLILMDLDMPGVDGWEATRRIKADPVTAAIPIIALTGHTTEGNVARAVTLGFNGYEIKPITYSRLMEKVNGFLETHN